jgi:hypothetical protein
MRPSPYLISCCLFFLFAFNFLKGQQDKLAALDAYPDFGTMVEYAVKMCVGKDPNHLDDEYQLLKAPSGWELEVRRGGDLLGTYVLWSSKTKSYVRDSLPLPGANPSMEEMLRIALSGYEDFYNENIFYGYPEWMDDVLKLQDKGGNLSDKLLYHFARAYCQKADNLIGGDTPFQPSHPFDQTWDSMLFTTEVLDRYDSLKWEAIDMLKRLTLQNPKYPIRIGFPAMKYGNEHVDAWLRLEMIGMHERATKWLKEDIYSASMLDFAYNILVSCPDNSILFVNGDNDTYPLLWLQKTKGIRSDVTVFNVSLLHSIRYLRYFSHIVPVKQRVDFGMDMDRMLTEASAYANITDKTDSALIGNLLAVQGKSCSLHREDGKLVFEFIPGATDGGQAPNEGADAHKVRLSFEGRKGSYLLRGEMAILGILLRNFGQRPTCFASTVDQSSFMGLQSHFSHDGFIYELRMEPQSALDEDPYKIGSVDPNLSAHLLLNEFHYDGLVDKYDDVTRESQSMGNLRATFYRSLLANAATHSSDTLRLLIDRYQSLYDPTMVESAFYDHQIADMALKQGREAFGRAIYRRIFKDMEEAIRQYEKGTLSQFGKSIIEYRLAELPKRYAELGFPKEAKTLEGWKKRYEKQLNSQK